MSDKHGKRITVRLDDEEYERISKQAAEQGATISECIRSQINGEYGTHQFISRGVANQSIVQFINEINPMVAELSDDNKKRIERSLNTLCQTLK